MFTPSGEPQAKCIERLLSRVRREFPAIPFPALEKMIDRASPSAAHEVRPLARWTNWQAVPGEVLEVNCAALSFLSPEGYAALLPACMRHFLDAGAAGPYLTFHETLAQSLLIACREDATHQRESRLSALSRGQRCVVGSFAWCASHLCQDEFISSDLREVGAMLEGPTGACC